jgi:hypothetical protein
MVVPLVTGSERKLKESKTKDPLHPGSAAKEVVERESLPKVCALCAPVGFSFFFLLV